MDDSQIAKLLEKYLNGKCSAEEVKAIDDWYIRHEDQGKVMSELPDSKRKHLKKEMLHTILLRISDQQPRTFKTFLFSTWFKVAAAASLILLLNLLYFNNVRNGKATHSNEAHEIVNHTRKMLKQSLPDGSVVWMNPQASIRFPNQFSGQTREVTVEGELFFEVIKNPQRPFIVRSAHLVTKVWGTSFKVSDRRDQSAALVSVATGKVSVSLRGPESEKAIESLHDHEVILLPNDRVSLNVNRRIFSKSSNVESTELLTYKRFNLKFENTSLLEIIKVLKSNFRIDIKIEGESLANKIMDADLTELNLPEILEVLKASTGLDYEIGNQQIWLKAAN